MKKLFATLLVLGALSLAWLVYGRLREVAQGPDATPPRLPAPVEVAPVERGTITLRRTFTGALEAAEEFLVAPKVGGRLERLGVDLGDPVKRGQVVAWLDDDEYVQELTQAEADLAVAKANVAEAQSALEISRRSLKRIEGLRERGVTSEAEYDSAQADELARVARLAVTEAQVTRAQAAVESARIRLGYTRVTADWGSGDDERVVAARYVDGGDTVGANARLFSVVELDPLSAVVFVPERDYGRLRVGQVAALASDTFPDEPFEGRIDRIAPVFRQSTRQARVELTVPNPGGRLKPGMFVRVTVELGQAEDVTIVPFSALTSRDDRVGVFVVEPDHRSVRWRDVTPGIREDDRVQVEGEGVSGLVVTLGQQLCEDGSSINIPDGSAVSGTGTGASLE